jgi:hypothetical protein
MEFSHFLKSSISYATACAVIETAAFGKHATHKECLIVNSTRFTSCSNPIGNGGAIDFVSSAEITVVNTSFLACLCRWRGGALCVITEGDIKITYSYFYQCYTRYIGQHWPETGDTFGGALYLFSNSTRIANISCNRFVANWVAGNGCGGAVYATAAEFDMRYTIFERCSVRSDGVSLNLSAGGAVYLVNLHAARKRLTIFRANFTGCLAVNGSAVYVEGFDVVFHFTHFDACTTEGSVVFVNSTDVAGATMEVPFVSFNDTEIGIRHRRRKRR